MCKAVAEMCAGIVDVDLGGQVFKKRIAMPGRGKRGGARVIVGTRLGSCWFFLYGFEKNERDNINDRELAALQKLARSLLSLDSNELDRQVTTGELKEICHEAQPHSH